MLLQQGHGKGVDWWCLGILIAEMLSGRHPFDGGSHYQTLRNMVGRLVVRTLHSKHSYRPDPFGLIPLFVVDVAVALRRSQRTRNWMESMCPLPHGHSYRYSTVHASEYNTIYNRHRPIHPSFPPPYSVFGVLVFWCFGVLLAG